MQYITSYPLILYLQIMVLGDYADFYVWLGSVIERVPIIRYVGGIKVWYLDVDKERLFYDDWVEMYTKVGGQGTNIAIYYSLPQYTLDNGIKLLEGDMVLEIF